MASPELDHAQGVPREHAAARYFRRSKRFVLVMAGIGALASACGLALGSPLTVTLGLITFGAGVYRVRRESHRERAAKGFVFAQHAHAALEDGRLDAASDLLDRFPAKSTLDLLRAQALLRAKLALRRGHLDAAVAHANEALQMKKGESETTFWLQAACAHGLRALAHAASGRPAEATADIGFVMSSGYGFGDASTYAMLAQGVLLERDGKKADLGLFLEQNRQRLRRGAGTGERALLRAWARMLVVLKRSVYRETADKADALEAAFVSAISPSAARFAEAPPLADDSEDDRAAAAAEETPRRKTLFLAAAALGAFAVGGVAWGVFGRSSSAAGNALSWSMGQNAMILITLIAVVTIPLAAIVAWGVFAYRNHSRQHAAQLLYRAYGAQDAGDLGPAGALAAQVAKNRRMPVLTAPAELILSDIALERGDAALAELHATRGLDALKSKRLRDFLSDTVVASLVANQAFAIAAQGRVQDAEAALSRLPPNGFARRQRFPVELLIAWAKNDRAAMLRLVKRAPASLGPTAELMADLARAVLEPEAVGLPELLRVRVEVSRTDERRLLLAYVPGLVSELEEVVETSPTPGNVRILAAEGATNEDAERDAQAVEEAQRAVSLGAV